jgi:hypothetical protein
MKTTHDLVALWDQQTKTMPEITQYTDACGRLLSPGILLHFFYSDVNPNNRVVMVRDIVDVHHVVFCQWSEQRESWIYEIQSRAYFEYFLKVGILRKYEEAVL